MRIINYLWIIEIERESIEKDQDLIILRWAFSIIHNLIKRIYGWLFLLASTWHLLVQNYVLNEEWKTEKRWGSQHCKCGKPSKPCKKKVCYKYIFIFSFTTQHSNYKFGNLWFIFTNEKLLNVCIVTFFYSWKYLRPFLRQAKTKQRGKKRQGKFWRCAISGF